MPTRTLGKRKRGKSKADIEEGETPIDTRLLEEDSLRARQQLEALQTPPPSNEGQKDAAPIDGESEEDIRRVFDFINSIQNQQRLEGDADSEDSRTEGRADADAERAGIGQSSSSASNRGPPSPPASAASAPIHIPMASTSAHPRKKAAGASGSARAHKPSTRSALKKSEHQKSEFNLLMENMQDLYNSASNPALMTIAQNAMRNLADYKEYKETGMAPVRFRQVPTHTSHSPPAQAAAANNDGPTIIDPAPPTAARSGPSTEGWVYISFEGKKIRIPADSLDKWRVVYPDVVVLEQDASYFSR